MPASDAKRPREKAKKRAQPKKQPDPQEAALLSEKDIRLQNEAALEFYLLVNLEHIVPDRPRCPAY
jgi:hypothetical protein